MSTIVIFGSNVGIIPLIQKLKGVFDKILILGHDENQMGANAGDEFKKINYRDLKSIINALSSEVDIVGFIPGAHDLHYLAYAKYMDFLNGSKNEFEDLFELTHNKSKFRLLLRKIAPDHCPKFISLKNLFLSELDDSFFPALFKPDHAGGGFGIFFIESINDYKKKKHLFLNNSGVLEQYIVGVDYSISLWLKNGILEFFYADRELSEGAKFRISGSITSFNLIQKFNKLNIPLTLVNIITAMGISNGFVHCQIRMNENGQWFLIEITQRLPGDCYPIVPEFFFGFPYSSLYLSAYIPDLKSILSSCYKSKLRIPDNYYYGRACITSTLHLTDKAYRFFEFYSHLKCNPESYKIVFYTIPSSEKIDLMSQEFYLTFNTGEILV